MVWKFDRFGKNVAAITEDGERYTYADLNREGKLLCEAVGKRCVVMCLCTNTFASMLGYLSFINGGIVPIMIDTNLDDQLTEKLYTSYKPDYIWAPSDIDRPAFLGLKEIYGAYGYKLLKTEYSGAYPLYDELALLLTTSGSTGSPKLVRQSYANIISNTESIVKYLEITDKDVTITTLPMNYTYGLSIINTYMYVGASIVLTDKTLMHKEFWALFKENGITSFGGVPYIYEMLEKLRFRRMTLPSLVTMTQAGGKLSVSLHQKFAQYAEEQGKRFVVMYGQTEATARMAYLPYDKSIEKCGSMGIAIPGGKFSLIDVNGEEITQPHIAGELVYYGENVTLGYAECGEDLIKGDERHGVLKTGDVAKRDEDGYYYIVGRLKRFLKIFGSRVNLDETERLINEKYPGINCVCGGVDDKMYVFVENDSQNEALLHFLCEKTSFSRAAFKLVKINSIPRSESGKVKYSELEKYYV